MLGEATWGELKADYNRASESSFGGLFKGVGSYFSKEYVTGLKEGARSAVWETPKSMAMSVIQPIRHDIFNIAPIAESLPGFKLEILKDLAKPIAYTIGHIRHRIFKDLSLTEPFTWVKSGWGLVTLPFAMLSGVGSAAMHLPGDLLSLPASLIGASAMTVGSIGQQFFSALRTFGKGSLVASDAMERSVNRFLVPPGWAEARDAEYSNITRWGQEFAVT